MLVLLIYVALFAPLLLVTRKLRSLRAARGGYVRFMSVLFLVLFALGFFLAPFAAVGLLLLFGVAAVDTVRELLFRHRTVQYLRGRRPAPRVPGARRGA